MIDQGRSTVSMADPPAHLGQGRSKIVASIDDPVPLPRTFHDSWTKVGDGRGSPGCAVPMRGAAAMVSVTEMTRVATPIMRARRDRQ